MQISVEYHLHASFESATVFRKRILQDFQVASAQLRLATALEVKRMKVSVGCRKSSWSCLINVCTLLAVSQFEASSPSVPYSLRATVARPLFSMLPLATRCRLQVPNQIFIVPSCPLCPPVLCTLYSLSPFSYSGASHHLFHNLSLSMLARFSHPGHTEQKLLQKRSRLWFRQSLCSTLSTSWSYCQNFRPGQRQTCQCCNHHSQRCRF